MDCGENLKSVADSRSGAISIMHGLISVFIEEFGRRYIESSEFKKIINCPQGKIELPIDTWHCKDTKTPCPLQGQLDISDPEVFLKLCLLSEETKNGILNAILEGKYKGFHHVPGRYRARARKSSFPVPSQFLQECVRIRGSILLAFLTYSLSMISPLPPQ